MSAVAPAAPPRAPLRQRAHWTDRVAHVALLAVALALVAFLRAAAADDPRRSRCRTATAHSSAWPTSSTTSRRRRCCSRSWNSVWVSALVTVRHRAARLRLRLRADAQLHAASRALFRTHHADPAAGAVAAVGHLADLLVRQPGRRSSAGSHRWASTRSTARRASCCRRVLRGLPACADDPDHRADRSPTRASTRPPTPWAPRAARKFFTITLPGAKYGLISAALVDLHAGDHRLRHPEGDRRQLQHARHRRLQAGHRPAGLPEGRGGRPAAAGAGAC